MPYDLYAKLRNGLEPKTIDQNELTQIMRDYSAKIDASCQMFEELQGLMCGSIPSSLMVRGAKLITAPIAVLGGDSIGVVFSRSTGEPIFSWIVKNE